MMSLCFAVQSHSGEFSESTFTTVDQLEKLRNTSLFHIIAFYRCDRIKLSNGEKQKIPTKNRAIPELREFISFHCFFFFPQMSLALILS